MAATHLAARLGVTPSTVTRLETSEAVEVQTRALAENLLKGSRRALWKASVAEKSAT